MAARAGFADLTASALHHPGGRIVVVAVGIGLLAGGAYIAYEAWRKRFLRQLSLAGASSGLVTFGLFSCCEARWHKLS